MDTSQQSILLFTPQQEEGKDVWVDGSQDCGLISLADCSMVQRYCRSPQTGSFTYPGFSHGSVEQSINSFSSQGSAMEHCWLNWYRWSIVAGLHSPPNWCGNLTLHCQVNTHYKKQNISDKNHSVQSSRNIQAKKTNVTWAKILPVWSLGFQGNKPWQNQVAWLSYCSVA